jgi:transcriptional regulator with XRE-family HTH domain
MDVGEKIKVLRLLLGESQTHLAKDLGMQAATHIIRWENYDAMPRVKMLQKLGESLGVHWPWLQDSSLEISKEKVLEFNPMNLITPYTPRWTALMTQQLPQYLPRLLTEINIQAIKCFVAPCGGGIIVAQKDGLALKITCLPVLFSAVVSTLPEHQKIKITDLTYLKDSLIRQQQPEIYDECGLEFSTVDETPEPAPPQRSPVKEFRFSGRITADDSINENILQERFKQLLSGFFEEAGLLDSQVSIKMIVEKKVTAADLVVDPKLKKLAEMYKDQLNR